MPASPQNTSRPIPRQDEWPNLASLDENTTNAQLARAAVEIKRTADGRTCGECEHYREGWCNKHESITGHNLAILYPTAIACTTFSAAEVRA